MGSELFWKHYDRMYAGKYYAGEVSTIQPLLGGAFTLLDAGCGTGEHSRQFANRMVSVIGCDTDCAAVGIAVAKGIRGARFECRSVETLGYKGFDAAVSLFNVVNYILTGDCLASFFAAIHRRLKPSSVFVFDCWNGEAVRVDPPRIKRTAISTLTPTWDGDIIHMRLDACVDGEAFVHEYDHRPWTPGGLHGALQDAGFVNIVIARWMQPAIAATIADWKIMFICEKGGGR